MLTYVRIAQMNGFMNERIELVLCYLAGHYNLINGKEIMRKVFYKKCIAPRMNQAAGLLGIQEFHGSRRQFKKVSIHKKGRFPIHISVYLYTLYILLRECRNKGGCRFAPRVDNVEYTEFMIGMLSDIVHNLLLDQDALANLDPIDIAGLHTACVEMETLDDAIINIEPKIFNNIW